MGLFALNVCKSACTLYFVTFLRKHLTFSSGISTDKNVRTNSDKGHEKNATFYAQQIASNCVGKFFYCACVLCASRDAAILRVVDNHVWSYGATNDPPVDFVWLCLPLFRTLSRSISFSRGVAIVHQ